ncbi:MAG: S8 family serine peptidase [Thermoanaerobaculia bacterium]
MSKRRASAVVLPLAFAGMARAALASAPVDERIFGGKAPGERASFLVVLRRQADVSGASALPTRAERRRFVFEALRATADWTQRALRDRLVEAGARFRPFWLINMIEVEADRTLAAELAGREEVALVAADRPASLSRPEATEPDISPLSAAGVEPSLELVRAPAVWNIGATGQGIVIGIADTGVAWEHPALKGRYRGFDGSSVSHGYNWHDAIHDAAPGNPCGSNSPFPCEDFVHGSHVTGTAVGTDGGENRIGMAPGARWIGCRNMEHGEGTPARYTECFEFFLAPTDSDGENPRPDLGADVINNSWYCPPEEGCTDPNVLRLLFENTRAAGIFLSVAAGNRGANGCASIDQAPALYEASFSVGATSLADTIAAFSSRGPVAIDGSNRLKPDVVAPGVSIRSSVPPDAYSAFQGTSMAAPHVSGAVALIWSAAPWLAGRVPETEEILRATAVHLTSNEQCGGIPGSSVPNPIFGWGRIDVAAAVSAALLSGPPPAPRIPVSRSRPGSRTVSPRN